MAKEFYDHVAIEKRTQEKWAALHLNETDLADAEKDPYYLLVEFPYPSGDLHIGHWYAFAVTDIYARYLRLQGKNVLFPFGFDAFGLPAENAAIKRGLDPKEWTYQNMDTMRTQIKQMGASFDWTKEVVTCEPSYYKWTQWLFSKLYEQKLAERREAAVKWCPIDQTVLANEQVINGHCERCGSEVEEKILTQWFLKITQYAKRLIDDLEPLPWRREIKDAQIAWIGESEGAKIFFDVRAITNDDVGIIEVFTTRPDTIFGATYIVLAPEHPLVNALLPLTSNQPAIEEYRLMTTKKTERERSENKTKTGVQLHGIMAVNPATNQEIPIFLADYVLASYGTGAVMAVPAHDERDFEFAELHNLPIIPVVEPLFIKTSGEDTFRSEVPIVKREAVACVVKHWSEDTYLLLKWKNIDWAGFVTGGIDNDDPVDAGKREILEETGYKNARFVRDLGQTINVQFYHINKKENRHARFQGLLFELENDERDPISEAEQEICDIHWVPRDEVEKSLTVPDMKLIWNRALGEDSAYVGDGLLSNSREFSGRNNREAMADIVQFIGAERVTNYRIRDWLVSRQRYWGCPIPVVYDPEGNPHLVPTEHLPWILPTDVDFTPTGKSPLATSKELHERVERIFGKGWTPEYDTLDTFVDSSWYYMRYLDSKNVNSFSDEKLMKKWLPVNRYSGGSEHTTMHLLYARFLNKALYDMALAPTSEPFNERFNRGLILGPDGAKMSKSKGNVINPDDFVKKYGADAVRIYLAFIGPYNEPGNYPWNLDGVEAMRRFLDRINALVSRVDESEYSEDFAKVIGKAAAKVGNDADRFKFNTAISALMILVRDLEGLDHLPKRAFQNLLILLAPFAPHLAEHLWESVGIDMADSVHQAAWPELYEEEENIVKVIVQVNSKKKGEIEISRDATEEDAMQMVRNTGRISSLLEDRTPTRII
jgi:leucyl-tRNA synthetase